MNPCPHCSPATLISNSAEKIMVVEKWDKRLGTYDQSVSLADYVKLQQELEALRSENGRFREVLEKMSHLHKFELHCDPADFDFDAGDAYRAGSNNAYCEVTEMALEALNPKSSTPDPEEKE